ncbi:hypothetical protein ABT112_16570 [Streptomyces sp. NPDC002055]|uniref:hypothetical protein n=1 Tax=Streptomyces sp. NPDC002055 TaxID=3154534 RepID=UPI00332CBEB7
MREQAVRGLALGLGAFLLAACSIPGEGGTGGEAKPHIEADYPAYMSVESLTTTSDIAVRGHVVATMHKEVDEGGDIEPTIDPPEGDESDETPAPDPSPSHTESKPAPPGVSGKGPDDDGLPMVFLRYEVDDVITEGSGPEVSVGDQLVVGNIDTSAVEMDGASELVEGKSTVLYLERITDAESPGITGVSKDFYVPLSGDNGIFDVSGSRATARSEVVASLSGAKGFPAKKSGTHFTADVDQLKQVAQESGKDRLRR